MRVWGLSICGPLIRKRSFAEVAATAHGPWQEAEKKFHQADGIGVVGFFTKLPAAQAFEALKAAHGGTERNQLQQAGDVCRCLGWDDPILKWRISKLWTAYFSLLRAPVSIGHKAGRCWKMLEDAGSVVRKKTKSETHCAFPQELGCFRQSRLGRASTLANLPSQLRQRRSNPKISHMDYWLVVSTILKILVNGVGMTSHKWNGK